MGPVDHHKLAGLVLEINRVRDVVHEQLQQVSGPAVLLPDQVAFDGIMDRPGQHRAGQLRHEQIILQPQRHQAGRQFFLRSVSPAQ